MKKKVALLMAAVLGISAMAAMAGCGKGNEELSSSSDTASTKDDGNVTKLVFLRAGTEEARKNYWQEVVEGFEKENTDI